jgi:hypothetical protein
LSRLAPAAAAGGIGDSSLCKLAAELVYFLVEGSALVGRETAENARA